jgi:hypothetical protein
MNMAVHHGLTGGFAAVDTDIETGHGGIRFTNKEALVTLPACGVPFFVRVHVGFVEAQCSFHRRSALSRSIPGPDSWRYLDGSSGRRWPHPHHQNAPGAKRHTPVAILVRPLIHGRIHGSTFTPRTGFFTAMAIDRKRCSGFFTDLSRKPI